MVLLDQIIHILALPETAMFRQQLGLLHIPSRANVSWMFIDVDNARDGEIGSFGQYFAEEFSCRSPGTSLAEVEIERLPC